MNPTFVTPFDCCYFNQSKLQGSWRVLQVLIKVLCADFGQLGGWVELDNYHSSLHVHPTLSIWEASYIQQNGSLSQDLLVPHQHSFKKHPSHQHPILENTWAVTSSPCLLSYFLGIWLLITQYISVWDDHQPWNPTVICSPHPGRISLHRRGAPSRRCLAGPRSAEAQRHGSNAAWRGVGRWRASRPTMRAARRHLKKEVNAGKFLEIFCLLGFYQIFPKFFCISLVGGGLIFSSSVFFWNRINPIRSLSNHCRWLSPDAIGGPGFLANLSLVNSRF